MVLLVRKGRKRMNSEDIKWLIYGSVMGIVSVFISLLAAYKVGDGWLGFWGGYLGAILSGIIALVVVRLQINADRQLNKEEKNDNTFYYLYSLLESRKFELISNSTFQALKKDIYDSLVDQLKIKGIHVIEIEGNSQLIVDFSKILICELGKIKDTMMTDIDDPEIKKVFLEYERKPNYNTSDWDQKYVDTFDDFKRIVAGVEKIKEAKKLIEDKELTSDNLDYIFERLGYLSSFNDEAYVEEINYKYNEFFSYLLKVKGNDINLLDTEDIKVSINDSFNRNFSTIGQYYKIFSSIVQFINTNVEDSKKFNVYIEHLCADMSIIEEILLFYYIEYTDLGENIKEKLYGSNIFRDLKNINYSSNPNNLDFFYDTDLNDLEKYNLKK